MLKTLVYLYSVYQTVKADQDCLVC